MAAVPSVKGSLIAASVEDLNKLVKAGTLSEAELERRLEPGDLEVISQAVSMMVGTTSASTLGCSSS